MVCRTFIQGFVDGAISTNPSVIEHDFEEAEALGNFKKRAIDTRIGQKMARFGESYLVDVCLPPRILMMLCFYRFERVNPFQPYRMSLEKIGYISS
jgi:hypothetical protein